MLGYRRVTIILGTKFEDCIRCHQVTRHVLVRNLWWFTVFRIPIVQMPFNHGLQCTACGEWTGVSALTAWRATRSGVLHLERARPDFDALPPQDEHGISKPDAAQLFDPVTINRKRGGWDLYSKVWTTVAAVVVAAALAIEALQPSILWGTNPVSEYGPAHTCWADANNNIVGCELSNGGMAGTTSTHQVVCYGTDQDVLSTSVPSLHCNP